MEKTIPGSQLLYRLAPSTCHLQAALYFPEMEGKNLKANSEGPVHTSELLKGKISLVAMLSTRISEAHVESYAAPILETFKTDINYQYVQINCQENTLKWMLVGIFASLGSLKKSIPEDMKATYLVSTQSLEYLREVLFTS